MRYWEKLTRQANQAYSNHAFLEAVDFNQQALDQILEGFEEDFCLDPESAVAAMAVSYLSIAESYTGLGDVVAANRQFEKAIDFLQDVIARPGLALEQRDLILQTMNHIRFEWELLTQSCGKEVVVKYPVSLRPLSHAAPPALTTTFH
ncbi:tetratricopeptide repeat protein [Marinomonas spartinae]|uniref:tetratricopeptide repeat protein n=1 Tax=Marinomonas spartinae TaxID=1792290 RepID=UPI0018F137D1|nr:tetratricopeptide repeat protein [Marinomonas spartinae]MBJ7555615.1 tetratricopeptide repeat protein [Marinomonas spartinae]